MNYKERRFNQLVKSELERYWDNLTVSDSDDVEIARRTTVRIQQRFDELQSTPDLEKDPEAHAEFLVVQHLIHGGGDNILAVLENASQPE